MVGYTGTPSFNSSVENQLAPIDYPRIDVYAESKVGMKDSFAL